MKRFLLYLSALFLSVSFANAQTIYEINSETGVLNNGTSKSSVWTANDCPEGLKITATDSNGNAVNAISYWSPTYKFYAAGLIDGTSNSSSSPTTYTISVNDGYLITGYKLEYQASSRNAVSLSNEYGYTNAPSNTSKYDMTEKDLNTRTTTFTVLSPVAARASSNSVNVLSFTVTVQAVGEGGEEPGDDSTIMEQYAAIEKPTFGKTGNTTFIKSATVDGAAVENIPEYIADDKAEGVARQSGVTTAIEVAPGAQFNLNITYQLNWGDLAIYQIDNDGATKEYGYYHGSWEPGGSTAKVAQNIAEDGIYVTEVVDEVCTATFPITINESHNPGDVIVVRAITGVKNDATNSAYEQGIKEGGYVDFLFVVAEEEPAEDTSDWSTFYQSYPVMIPEGANAYIVTAAASDYVTLTRFEGTIPANTAVILNNGEPKGEAVDVDFSTNLLKGTTVDTYINEKAYVLSRVDGVVGFYKAEMTDGTWLNNAAKAYLPASAVPAAVQGAASFSFRFGEGTTGIEEVKGENGNVKVIYDLTGRRVEAITEPGIYIVNGKKVLVK